MLKENCWVNFPNETSVVNIECIYILIMIFLIIKESEKICDASKNSYRLIF